jgi:catechol 2,3-dioxygenase-like lactoylglutathione lyase family enzyme
MLHQEIDKPMIASATHLFEAHLVVGDLDAAIDFYRDRLGFALADVTPTRHAAFLWIGPRGKTMLGLWLAGPAPQKTTSHIAFAASLDDVIAAPRMLQAAGVPALDFDGRATDEAVVLAWMPAASAYFRDPDGHLLEYIAMLSESPAPDRGVVPWHEWRRSTSGAE